MLVPILTQDSVYVTVTPTDCAGECLDAALSSSPSTGSRNALSVLTSALLSFAPQFPSTNALSVLSEATLTETRTVNALSVLTSALETNSPVPPVTFSPAIFTSYGLVTEATGLSSQTVPAPAPTAPSSPAAPPPGMSSPMYSGTTLATSPAGSAPPASSTPAGSEVSPGTTSAGYSGTATEAIPPTLTGSALSSYIASAGSSPAGAPTSSTANAGGVTGASSSPSGSPTGKFLIPECHPLSLANKICASRRHDWSRDHRSRWPNDCSDNRRTSRSYQRRHQQPAHGYRNAGRRRCTFLRLSALPSFIEGARGWHCCTFLERL